MTRVIRVDAEVRAAIARLARDGETPNATLRRLLKLAPRPYVRRTSVGSGGNN